MHKRGVSFANTIDYCKRCYFRVTKFSRLAAQKHIRGLLNLRWADAHLSFWYCTMLTSFNEWYIYMYVCNWVAQKQSRSQTDLGQNFERCTIGHFQTLRTSITPGSPPVTSETISFGVVVKSTNRAFRKHILYIPLLIFVHHTVLQMQKNDKKWCF